MEFLARSKNFRPGLRGNEEATRSNDVRFRSTKQQMVRLKRESFIRGEPDSSTVQSLDNVPFKLAVFGYNQALGSV